jgi:hypothetical protein
MGGKKGGMAMSEWSFKSMSEQSRRAEEERLAAHGRRLEWRARAVGAGAMAAVVVVLAYRHRVRRTSHAELFEATIVPLVFSAIGLLLVAAILARLHFKTSTPCIRPDSPHLDRALYQAYHALAGATTLLLCLGVAFEVLATIFLVWFE